MKKLNLNEIELENDGNFSDYLIDNSTSDTEIEVYFRGLEETLIKHINESAIVLGCVAWLTHPKILDALSRKECSIIVQKEDFLRPDLDSGNNWSAFLRGKYDKLKCTLTRYEFLNLLPKISYASDPTMDPIRCVGNHNKEKQAAFPRMHNKFLVFGNLEQTTSNGQIIKPYAVWTGSFNFTKNAGSSLENAVLIKSPKIVAAYLAEFEQIAAISEPLDWTQDWCAPQWRIGS